MAEPTATGFVQSLTGQFQDNINKAKESATSAAMGHFGKIGDEFKNVGANITNKLPFSITKKNDAAMPVEEVKPAAAPAAGGRRRSRRKSKRSKKSKKRKTSRRGRKSKKRVRFSKRK